jgi:hypothetical protein
MVQLAESPQFALQSAVGQPSEQVAPSSQLNVQPPSRQVNVQAAPSRHVC